MSGELAPLAADVMPYVSAAVSAYGAAVLVKVRDDAADATVSLGRRILQRIFGWSSHSEPLPDSLQEVVAYPNDPDALAVLQLEIRKALAADAELREDIEGMLPNISAPVTASGERSIAGRNINGVAITGDNATIIRKG